MTDTPEVTVTNEPMPAQVPVEDPTIALRVKQFVDVRDKINEIEERHKAELKDYKELKNMLEGWLQKAVEATGGTSVRTPNGTATVSTRYSTSLADPEAFMKFVIENQKFDLLDRRANATAVKDYVGEHSVLPPGVNLTALRTVGVRRPTGKT